MYFNKLLKLCLFIVLSSNLLAVDIDENTSGFDLLSQSKIFVDKTNSLSFNQAIKSSFTDNKKEILGYGFVENYAVWVKFTLKNTTNKTINKILEYAHAETEDVYFYDGNKLIVDGMFHISKDRKNPNPEFKIELKAYEERTYYIKAHCDISTLIVRTIIWNEDDLRSKQHSNDIVMAIFFSVITILLVYNFMLYVFTLDKVYLYYVLYLVAVMLFQSIYLCMAQLYIFSNEITILVTKATTVYISLLVWPIILFSREFLNTYKFPKIDIFFKFYLYLMPVISFLSYDNLVFNLDILVVFIPLGIMMVYTGFYALYKGEKQARFYILGWSFLIIALVLSVLKSMGGFDITYYFEYTNELAFVLEALLFSIALAHRIKLLAEQKISSDAKLIEFQRLESSRLIELVDEKTKDLHKLLEEKEFLYKELNHRVKNNLQMILSLIKLQVTKATSLEVKDELSITKGRIHSISHLYERLNVNNHNNAQLDTREYFENIVNSLNIEKDINIVYNIAYELDIDKLIYCGLIVNELVTNSMKYAFKESGEIIISLYERSGVVYLSVADDGMGIQVKRTSSLGLKIVETLATKQLLGDLEILSDNGTKIIIQWDVNAKS